MRLTPAGAGLPLDAANTLGYQRCPMAVRKAKPSVSVADIDRLIESAARIREQAYAPYSRFRVGAAVLSSRGHIYLGCNVENSSYGLSLCAERAAIAAAVAAGDSQIIAAGIVTGSEKPTPPCGMCLQTLVEFGGTEAQVALSTLRGVRQQFSLGELMPHAFDRSFL